MTKQQFKNDVKNGLIFTYGYATKKEYDFMKEKNIKFKKDLQPIKKTMLHHIGSSFKDITIESYDGFIILYFKDFNNIAIYKKMEV